MELNNEFFREILDKLDEGVYFVDLDRKITYWNGGAERITGYQKDEVIGSFCCDNVLMHVDKGGENLCTGHCPMAKSMNDGTSSTKKGFTVSRNDTGS